MLIKIIKWSAIAALIGGMFCRSLPDVGLISQFAIVAAATVVLIQAANAGHYVWMVLFAVVICLFSPILPVPFSGHISGAVTLFLFFFSLQLSEPRPRLSLASISDRMPGSESL